MAADSDASYRQDGYQVHRAVLGANELDAFRAEVDRVWANEELTRPGNGRTRVRPSLTGGAVVDRLDPVSDVSPMFDALARGEVLSRLAALAVGGPALLFKDKLIAKPAGVGGYGLHQDYMRWQSFGPSPDQMVTLAVALDPATGLNGGVEVYAGQHEELLTPPNTAADPHPDDVDEDRRKLMDLAAGDVMAFHPLIPHRSGFNRSGAPRRMLFLTYADARYGDLRPEYYARHEVLFGDALSAEVVPMALHRRGDAADRS